MPWSTRAVIFLAFAIQLGPIGERLTATPAGPADCLTLCDGRLLAILYDVAGAQQAASVEAASAMVRVADPRVLVAAGWSEPVSRPGLDQAGSALLPLPPPAGC